MTTTTGPTTAAEVETTLDPPRRRGSPGAARRRPRRLAVPRALPGALRRLRPRCRSCSGCGSACTTGTSRCRASRSSASTTTGDLFDARLGLVRAVLELDAGHRHLHAVQRAAAARRAAGVALVMNQKFRGRNLFRAIFFAPYVLGVAVVGVLWRFLLDANIGAVNYYLGASGCPTTPRGSARCRRPGSPWSGHRLVDARLQRGHLPRRAAGHPDASSTRRPGSTAPAPWARFRHVTLPGLRPVTMFVTMITIIASANMFGQSFLMTKGAPGRETRTAIYHIAETGLQNFQMGEAAAASLDPHRRADAARRSSSSACSATAEVTRHEVMRAAASCATSSCSLLTLLFISPLLFDAAHVVQDAGGGRADAADVVPEPVHHPGLRADPQRRRHAGAPLVPQLDVAATANAAPRRGHRVAWRRTPWPGWSSAARRSSSG